MRCQDFQTHLLDVPEASMNPILGASMDEHLSGCHECQEFQGIWERLVTLGTTEAPAGMADRFRDRLSVELLNQKPSMTFTRSWWFPLSVAAALLLSLGMVIGYSLRTGDSKSDPSTASLRNGTVADRMEAIAMVNAQTPGQGDMVSALIDRINHDPSLKVRLSAVEALYLFGAEPGLRHRIEAVLPGQTRPEVQLALIDLLGALRQKRAQPRPSVASRRKASFRVKQGNAPRHASLR